MHPTSRLTVGAARRRLAGLCCVPLLALAGCSGGQEDPEPIIRTGAASESPASPSAEPGKQPWQKRTKAGAVAFVRHWIDLLNQANASGDTTDLRDAASSDCNSCSQVANGIDSVYQSGGTISGGRFAVEQAGTNDSAGRSQVQVATRVSVGQQTVHAGDGSTQSSQATTTALVLTLSWTAKGWRLSVLERT